ncbi:MAG: succinate dehydrogenase [Deltaproteobacteria bacterium]|nr:succinate dehydrogenase [Deltaproteobacteria bacterium]MCW5803279.1 succinate dehydrogenase [Deltaproteobacteria bacterium]
MATHLPVVGGYVEGFGKTCRTDDWKSGPLITLIVFSTFVIYTTWAALQGNHYFHDPYLSPFYSPVLYTDPSVAGAAPASHAWIGTFPSWWPAFVPLSPAILILVFPGSFRFTCYYYRKAYYRAFAGSPPGCAVGPLNARRRYRGETAMLVFQNLHRYALYFALIFILILGWDAIQSFRPPGKTFGVGVGSVILTINVVLIAAYTFGCHSFRHLVGGRKDVLGHCGEPSLASKSWTKATWFNERHMQFAWASLIWVMLTDVYIRLVSHGVIRDLHTW